MGELLEAIRGGEWCEQQASLMRALAFGILDPRGERYRLARLHQRECPACRAYILSLRGLAAVLPPLPLPWGLDREPHLPTIPAPTWPPPVEARAARGGSRLDLGRGRCRAPERGRSGGWLLGGSVGAKLAVSCLLALGVGLRGARGGAPPRGVRSDA